MLYLIMLQLWEISYVLFIWHSWTRKTVHMRERKRDPHPLPNPHREGEKCRSNFRNASHKSVWKQTNQLFYQHTHPPKQLKQNTKNQEGHPPASLGSQAIYRGAANSTHRGSCEKFFVSMLMTKRCNSCFFPHLLSTGESVPIGKVRAY